MMLIKKKISDQDEVIFNDEINSIGNMFFHISWIILLTSFNIHITIFFMERAALLLSEFILISGTEEKYVIESNSKINDAIIFTYKKTIGETTLNGIMKENEYIKNNAIYKSLLNVRNDCFLIIKIVNKILKEENTKYSDKLHKNFKQIISPIYNIYQIIDIDNYLFFKISKILEEEEISKALFLIKINLEIIDIFIGEFFFNNLDQEIELFLEMLDTTYDNFYKTGSFDNISYSCCDIGNKKIFQEFKNCVFRFIEI
tara:strand:- start:811 stop:1584 length:774 start_codon:yes stop_codon:yes gene_type:complete